MCRLTTILVVMVLLASSATADLVYPIAQERTLQAGVALDLPEAVNDTQSATAGDMSLWVESCTGSVSGDLYTVSSIADQYSSMGPDGFSAFGMADVEFDELSYILGNGASDSRYRVRFAVAAPVVFELFGSISVAAEVSEWACCTWAMNAWITVRLDQVAGPQVESHTVDAWLTDFDTFRSIDASEVLSSVGQLQPGVYELEVTAAVDAQTMELGYYGPDDALAEAAYVVDLTFAPLEPGVACDSADIDNDGDVDLLDQCRLQQCFSGPMSR